MGFGFTGNIVYDLHMIWRWVLLVVALVTLVKALRGASLRPAR